MVPFLGAGFCRLRQKKVGATVDLGLQRPCPPMVGLSADGPIADDPSFVQDLVIEQTQLQASLDDFHLYPYAQFGQSSAAGAKQRAAGPDSSI